MFKIMTGVLDPKKKPTDSEIEKIPSYIFCRWLSGNPVTVSAGNLINLYYDIPVVNQYHMIKSAFAGKIKYIPYPKNTTTDSLKKVELLSKHFNINLEKAKEYLELIDPKELQYIIDLYMEEK